MALAGTFNQWSISSHPLVRDGTSHVWTLVVPLPPGEHLFMYVVDGTRGSRLRWQTTSLDDGLRIEERCGRGATSREVGA